MKNILVLLSLAFLSLLVSFYGCSGDNAKSGAEKPVATGASTFKKYCTACHGADGKMGLNGAANLSQSTLTKDEVAQVVTNGRKLMAPYKSILSPDEINDVADYVLTLRE